MTPTEIYVYLEAKQPAQYYSGMSGDDVDELIEMSKGEGFL
tara:strand:+ start:376 stop:498 length:123 start_codon:yes stop_codon:yes gene_type:complete